MLTSEQLASIKAAALRKADWYDSQADRYLDLGEGVRTLLTVNRRKLIDDLRHIALDCEFAADGCAASLDSVLDYIDGDMDLSRAAESYIPAGRAA